MRFRVLNLSLLCLGAIGVAATDLSGAQTIVTSETPSAQLLNSTFQIDVGMFVLSQSTKASLQGQGTNNPQVNFNQAFGAGYNTERFRVDGLWRITERQHVEFMYFTNGISRSRTIPADDPVEWGNYAFSGDVTAKSRLSVYELGYEYAFMKTPTFEWAAGAGIHYTKVKLELDGNAVVTNPDGTMTPLTGTAKTASVPAPLPVLATRAGWAFADNWVLDGQVQLLGFSYDQFHGHWWDVKAGVTYLFNKHIGVGAAYDSFTTQLSIEQSNFNGRLNLGYRGGELFLRGAF